MADNINIRDKDAATKVMRTTDTAGVHTPHHIRDDANAVSTVNSTATLLNAAAVFTGTAEDVMKYDSVVVAVKTDQDGTLTVQFSNDGTNWDSTLTRYYRTSQIEAPHRFTIARKYVRVVFTNTSASNQTYLRLQTMFGSKTALNAPTDSVLAQDYDAIVTRPTNFSYETTLGRRQGATTWNKFGINEDVDIGTEGVWAYGGLFTHLTSASTLTIVSSSTDDDSAGTGARTLTIFGLDANRDEQTETIAMDGTTPVVTATTWLGINRAIVTSGGSTFNNVGNITVTATTGGSVQSFIPATYGTTQRCVFLVPRNHRFLVDYLTFNALRASGGTNPKVTFKGWVMDMVNQTTTLVLTKHVNTDVNLSDDLQPKQGFLIPENCIFYVNATTDQNNTTVACRFSGILFRDVDA